jgi:hypothetical protein
MEFLLSQPTLQHLDINLGYLLDDRWDGIWRTMNVSLPELTTLSAKAVDTQNVRMSTEGFIEEFIGVLDIPAVETMNIHQWVYEPELPDSAMEPVFPDNRHYPAMKRLQLTLTQEEGFRGPIPVSPFEAVFAKFPRLEVLTLTTDVQPVTVHLPDLHLPVPPPLRMLELKSCSRFDIDTLKKTLEYLKQGAHWGLFEQLIIEGCPEISARVEELYGVVPADKVTCK